MHIYAGDFIPDMCTFTPVISFLTCAPTPRARRPQHDGPRVAPDVPTKLTHPLHEHICPSPRAHLPHHARGDHSMMAQGLLLQGLLLIYLQNLRILSTSTLTNTCSRGRVSARKHDAPGIAPDLPTKVTHLLHEHICQHLLEREGLRAQA